MTCNKTPMRIGIVGGGVVGSATARSFMEWADVRVFDIDPARRTHSLAETLEGELIFVCLPTPQKPDSLECDLSAIESFFGEHKGCSRNFVLKSTVPIGTTQRLRDEYDLPNLVHSPEFLTARCSITDAQIPARNIIGSSLNDTKSLACRMLLFELYERRFPGVPIHCMSSDESEAVKLILNSFFAVKVSYWNEARALCDSLGLDWERVMGGVMSDGRIAHSHTKVPGPDGQFGFAGACLPKDLANMTNLLAKRDCCNHVTMAALTRNKLDRERTA